jgi:WD40 repeat protein
MCLQLPGLTQTRTFKAHKSKVFEVLNVSDYLITAAKDKSVKFWLNFKESYFIEHHHRVKAITITPNKKLIFSSDISGAII